MSRSNTGGFSPEQDSRKESLRDKILFALEHSDDTMTVDQLVALTHSARTSMRGRLSELRHEKKVFMKFRDGIRRYGIAKSKE